MPPGALHHIIVRGLERRKIFTAADDRYDLIDRLGRILEETNTGCYAWVLNPNHFHLLLRIGGVPIATVMRRLLTGYKTRFSRRHGHNRYKSILCLEEAYFLELVRYIFFKPPACQTDCRYGQARQISFFGAQRDHGQRFASMVGY